MKVAIVYFNVKGPDVASSGTWAKPIDRNFDGPLPRQDECIVMIPQDILDGYSRPFVSGIYWVPDSNSIDVIIDIGALDDDSNELSGAEQIMWLEAHGFRYLPRKAFGEHFGMPEFDRILEDEDE